MTFSSLSFLFIFFPVVFLLYALCRGSRARNIILAAASIVFYAFGEPFAVILLLASVTVNYLLGIMAAGRDKKQNKMFAAAAVVINLAILVCCKYTGFFMDIISGITGADISVNETRLPLGISFFTFQGISYVTDVYRDRRKAQKSFLNVLLYISFFPQIIAGPIIRFGDIQSQLAEREFSTDRVSRGIRRFIFGLGKKVLIANQLGIIADQVFGYSTDKLGTFSAWAGAVCYMLQIFFDFSGYSDMAIGLGCIFGFDYKENFSYPYVSSGMKEFWRRWHISLSAWFKEYVYIPLGGNRKGALRTDLNKVIVFLLCGLWHGANVTFVVWGLIQGFFQLLENHDIIPVKKKWFRPAGHVYVLIVTAASFVIFRSESMAQAGGILSSMFTVRAGDAFTNADLMTLMSPLFVITLILAAVFSAPVCRIAEEKAEEAGFGKICMMTESIGSLVIYLLCILSLCSGSYNPFIYYRF